MSRLSVYWPDELDSQVATSDDHMIIPFSNTRTLTTSIRSILNSEPKKMDVVTRARVLFNNRQCRDCGYPVVEPVELPDSAVNQSGLSIPGTATLVGFRCRGCANEWSV